MKLIATILFLFLSSEIFSQYVIHWEVSYNTGISQFQIEQSANNKKWTAISTIQPSNSLEYNDTLKLSENYYYRVSAAVGQTVFYSGSILIPSALPVIISNEKFTHIKVKK